jgi:hypothetical protein
MNRTSINKTICVQFAATYIKYDGPQKVKVVLMKHEIKMCNILKNTLDRLVRTIIFNLLHL